MRYTALQYYFAWHSGPVWKIETWNSKAFKMTNNIFSEWRLIARCRFGPPYKNQRERLATYSNLHNGRRPKSGFT